MIQASLLSLNYIQTVSCDVVAGYSQYAAAAAAAAAAASSSSGVFPYMSSAFSLFPPVPPPSAGIFSASSLQALPFGGLGSLADSALLSTASTPALDSATGKSPSLSCTL